MTTLLAIVVPCFNEQEVLPETNRRLLALCRSVWNLTSHMVCGDACGQGHGGQEGRDRQMRELAQT